MKREMSMWDEIDGVVADIYELDDDCWMVVEPATGVCATFRTRRQALYYARLLLPEHE